MQVISYFCKNQSLSSSIVNHIKATIYWYNRHSWYSSQIGWHDKKLLIICTYATWYIKSDSCHLRLFNSCYLVLAFYYLLSVTCYLLLLSVVLRLTLTLFAKKVYFSSCCMSIFLFPFHPSSLYLIKSALVSLSR